MGLRQKNRPVDKKATTQRNGWASPRKNPEGMAPERGKHASVAPVRLRAHGVRCRAQWSAKQSDGRERGETDWCARARAPIPQPWESVRLLRRAGAAKARTNGSLAVGPSAPASLAYHVQRISALNLGTHYRKTTRRQAESVRSNPVDPIAPEALHAEVAPSRTTLMTAAGARQPLVAPDPSGRPSSTVPLSDVVTDRVAPDRDLQESSKDNIQPFNREPDEATVNPFGHHTVYQRDNPSLARAEPK